MNRTTEFLTNIRRIIRLHDSMLKPLCSHYHLTMVEATIISFLYNNPGKDTAADIVELRMLSKGNVSQAVESLIQKSLLKRDPDRTDRRKIHLSLTASAHPITQEIDSINQAFRQTIFDGFSHEEQVLFTEFHDRLIHNIRTAAGGNNNDRG